MSVSTYASAGQVGFDSEPASSDLNKKMELHKKTHSIIISNDGKYNWHLYPEGKSYPRYIADPRHPQNGLMPVHYYKSEIPDGGKNRFNLNAGGRFGLLGISPKSSECSGLELSIECGLLAQFNTDDHLDNIGWDGLYGLLLAWQCSSKLAFKFATQHDSSHIGDEYIEATGTRRIEYTREELAYGVSYFPKDFFRLYFEIGRAYKYKQFMAPYRFQAGFEATGPLTLIKKSSGWYFATDIVSWEENDWSCSTTIQTGIRSQVPYTGRQYRMGVQFYNGRSHIGEFFEYNERYLSLGIWVDV